MMITTMKGAGKWFGALAVAGLTFGGVSIANADDDAAILASCTADLQLSASGCACVLDKVHEELNDNQRAFLVAAVTEDQANMVTAQMALTGEEMMEVATFMTTTPQQCQAQ